MLSLRGGESRDSSGVLELREHLRAILHGGLDLRVEFLPLAIGETPCGQMRREAVMRA